MRSLCSRLSSSKPGLLTDGWPNSRMKLNCTLAFLEGFVGGVDGDVERGGGGEEGRGKVDACGGGARGGEVDGREDGGVACCVVGMINNPLLAAIEGQVV